MGGTRRSRNAVVEEEREGEDRRKLLAALYV